ncbi:MAG: response regulator [Granulosicoccaceae bacterium]
MTQILLAVDDLVLAQALANILAHQYEIAHPSQTGQLLRQSVELQPSLILIDDANAEEAANLCQHLKRRLPSCRLLYLSSNWQASLAAQLEAQGVDAVLRKPFATDTLLQTIQQHLDPSTC